MSNFDFKERLARCTQLMHEEGIDVLILTKPSNMFYLTGDGRLCAYAMITSSGEVAMGLPQTDLKDVEQLAKYDYLAGFENEVGMIHSFAHYFKQFGIEQGTLGLEYTFLTQAMMGMLTHPHGKPKALAVKDCTPIMSKLRIVKDEEEIRQIRAAAKVADLAMHAAITAVKPGVTESQIAAAAEYEMRQNGAEGFWRSYVASGPRTNIAHGLPTLRKVEMGDLVTIDLHPIVNNYSADICRTVCVGPPDAEKQRAYDLYLKALNSTIIKIKAGVDMMDLENTMHGIFKEAGHEHHIFGPPIHGSGIDFEEAPLPAGHAFFHGEKAPDPLEKNTVIAVGNCGLYLGPWAVRVEETVVVGAQGPEILTNYPQSLTK